jgi:hypothetical protein
MMITRNIPALLLASTMAAWGQAENRPAKVQQQFRHFQSLMDNRELSFGEKLQQLGELVRGLNKEEFLSFVREIPKHPQYSERDDGGIYILMGMLVKTYLAGPGKGEPLMVTLAQIADPSLPGPWRLSLLEVTRAHKRPDLSRQEVAGIQKLLLEAGANSANSEFFRLMCLNELGRYLRDLPEFMINRTPALKDVLTKKDRQSLDATLHANPTDAKLREALEWFDAVDKYKATVRNTITQLKDDQDKARLLKRVEQLESPPGLKAR